MSSHLHARREGALGVLLVSCLAVAGLGRAATAPYPDSTLISAMSWDFSSVVTLRKAHGSDLWPLTWAADGNLYGAWGDGGGFDGDNNNIGRVSLGFALLSGTPASGEPDSYGGRNVWGAAPRFAEHRATFGGKVDDLISIDGVLYGQGGLWTAANCGCADPTLKPGDNRHHRTVTWSADHGRSWEVAAWTSSSGPGTSLQYGRNYQGAKDPAHVYFYFQPDSASDATRIYLRRVLTSQLTADPATPGHFEYLTAIDGEGSGLWSASQTSALPVFEDSHVPPGTDANATVVYDEGLGRYLMATQHGNGAGQMGFFEAPAPWGPWRTLGYYEDWGGFNESAGEGNGLSFPSKWMSSDGRTLWAVFSGAGTFDSFNVVKAVLTVGAEIPQIADPAAGTVLAPGERVSATGVGTGLSWSVESLGKTESLVATGTGPSLTFIVPEGAPAGSLIRVTLSNTLTQVSRDYAVSGRSGSLLVGDWMFDEGTGSTTRDSSGEGNTGTLVNGPVWVAGKTGHALDFRGGRAGVRVPGVPTLANLFARGLTVMAWVHPRSDGNSGRILDKDGNSRGWLLKMSEGGVQFVGDEFGVTAVSRKTNRFLSRNAWQHVAATWDGSYKGADIHLYVDGVPADGTYVNGGGGLRDDSAIPLTLGNRLFDLERGFDGILDDVRIYNRVLTPGEVHEVAMAAVSPSTRAP
ncbi:MAG TPA: LamG-like jellyroll fold domain-containing protein [Steroidobacteraceae bacterium]|nr:LamG-like jellyroll fold domain-containing protein [Steroidobacteraceae bacterium]